MDVRSILDLYFEADRSTVKALYDELFNTYLDEEGSDEEASDEDSDATLGRDYLEEVVSVMTESEFLSNQVLRRAASLNERDRIIAAHYLLCIIDDRYTFDHAVEGLVSILGVWASSPFLHAFAPDTVFPVDGSVSYLRLRSLLDEFEIEFVDSDELSEYEALARLSNAVYQWQSDFNLEPWQAWAAIYDLGPRVIQRNKRLPAKRDSRVWMICTRPLYGISSRCWSAGG